MRPGLTGLIVVGSQYTVGQKMYYHRQYFNEKSKIDLPPYLSWLECPICKHANIVWTQAKKFMTCLCITPVSNSSDLSCHSVLQYDHQNWVDMYNFLIVFTRVTQANWKKMSCRQGTSGYGHLRERPTGLDVCAKISKKVAWIFLHYSLKLWVLISLQLTTLHSHY